MLGEGGSYVATVNGTPIQIAAYVADPGDNGRVMVSLIVAADTLQVGIPSARQEPPPERRNEAPTRVWGDKALPDPRTNVAGWTPPPPAADAGRGRTGEHRLIGERFIAVLRRLVRGNAGRLA